MEWTSILAADIARSFADLLVCAEGVLFHLSIYMGTGHVAALPVRSTDGFRLEISVSISDSKRGDYGSGSRIEKLIVS